MLARLALLFVAVPLIELALLVWIGDRVGMAPTVALVVVTGILGAALARREGLAAWTRFRAAVAAGRMPHREIVEGLMVLIAGAMLLTPGLLTDLAGFLLLVPRLRLWAARRIGKRVAGRLTVVGGDPRSARGVRGDGMRNDSGMRGNGARTETMDVDYTVLDDVRDDVRDDDGPEPPVR